MQSSCGLILSVEQKGKNAKKGSLDYKCILVYISLMYNLEYWFPFSYKKAVLSINIGNC